MKKNVFGIAVTLAALVLGACNLPSGAPPAEVLEASATPTVALGVVDTAMPTLTPEAVILPTDTASLTPTPQDPLVLRATLCWQGPGPKFDVVSALNQNERVKLLGRGSISGWFVVDNPTYHDPCWVAEGDLQIEAGTDLSNLKIFTPPPTATPTPPPTPVPTATTVPPP
jgi:hypothetical protein